MSYLVLARRFRPQTFEEIVGQEHVTRTLENAIASERVAHAFLFSGARGVGKTTAARVLAKALNCVQGPTGTPCGECQECQGIADSRSVDVQEIDGASNNSVDDVRALRETVPYQPSSGRFKIYIIDEVHMLTTSAFNALLKTLEEPPAHVKFIFATTEPHKIPVTILSRCQRYDFRLVPTALIAKRLDEILALEKVKAEPAAISLLSREARGSMRDALSLLDQTLAYDATQIEAQQVSRLLGVADHQLLFQVSAALIANDAAGALRAVESAATFGCDLARFSHDVLRHLRNLVIAAQCPNDLDLIDTSDEERQELSEQVRGRDAAELHRLFLLFSKATEEIARSSQPRMLLEMTLARLASLEPMRSLEVLARKLEQLAAGGARPGAPAAGPQRRFPPADRPPPRQAPSRRSPPAEMPPVRRSPPPDMPPPRGQPAGAVQQREEPSPAPAPPPGGEQASSKGREPTQPTLGAQTAELADNERELWSGLLTHIQKTSPPLFHIVRAAQPVELSKTKVKVLLPNVPFVKGEAENPRRRQAFEKACKEFFHANPSVELSVADGAEGRDMFEKSHIEHAAKEQDRRREAKEHSAVRAALSEFEGARIETIKLFDDDDM